MKYNRTGYSGTSYNVEVEGFKGDNKSFCECQYWINKPVNNKQNAINYANKMFKLLTGMNLHNAITVNEICGDINNLILSL